MGVFRVTRVRSTIYVVYSHENKRYRKSTGLRVEEKYWNKNVSLVRQTHPNWANYNDIINVRLGELIDQVGAVKAGGVQPTVGNLKQHLTKLENRKKYDFFKDYLQHRINKGNRLSDNTLKSHRNTFNLCKEYQLKKKRLWDVETFNKAFYDDFINFLLLDKNLVDTTIQGHLKRLKSFLRSSYPGLNIRFISYRCLQQANDSIIYLHESELHILRDAELTRSSFNKVRDLFLFCSLTGMRYGDSQRYHPSWEDDGLLDFRMHKTGGKAYPPLYDYTKGILSRWDGAPPKISGQKYNQYLKELFKHLGLDRLIPLMEKQLNPSGKGYKLVEVHFPLHDVVSSHVARKTFITTALSKGIAIQDVMKMSGHSDFRAMRPYIAISKIHLRETVRKWNI